MTSGASIVLCASSPSPRLRQLAAIFGLEPRRGARRADLVECRRRARWIERRTQPGEITLIGGPSGTGKSTLMREIGRRAERGGVAVRADHHELARRTTPIADRHEGDHLLEALAVAGLAEARLLARTPDELSEGQRARLALADAAIESASATRSVTILVDEFASTLDRVTARSVARTWARWIRRTGARAFVATAHDDVGAWLEPSWRVRFGVDGTARIEGRGSH